MNWSANTLRDYSAGPAVTVDRALPSGTVRTMLSRRRCNPFPDDRSATSTALKLRPESLGVTG